MFNAAQARAVVQLLRSQTIAALGTLHEDEPFVSMVPYSLVPELKAFAIHVSALASHTRDMADHPAVSLMVTAHARPEDLAQGLARATFQCKARRCALDEPGYEAAKRSYLSRFPASEELFSFGDFSLFTLTPRYMRFIGGFAQATTVTAPELDAVLAQVP
jgi:putative heme iron utilization protein